MTSARDDSLELRSDIGEVLAQKKKGNSWIKYAAIAVVAILIIAAVVWIFSRTEDPAIDPVIEFQDGIDPTKVPAGMTVEFDASKTTSKNGIFKVEWDFGDGGTDEGLRVTHSYSQRGTYTVTVTVTDQDGKTGTTTKEITVVGTIVKVPMGKLGDSIDYDFSGFLDIRNPDGFWTYIYTKTVGFTKIKVTAKVVRTNITIDSTGSVTNGQDTVEDGFGEAHACVERGTTQDMTLSGYADVKLYPESGGGAGQQITQDISGSASANQLVYSDLTTNRTVRTRNSDKYKIQVGNAESESSTEKEGADDVTAFPLKREEFSVDALRSNRTFSKGESGDHTFGENRILWKVEREDAVGDKPCLVVHMWMDDPTMSKNGFTAFDTFAWISNDFSMPLKAYIRSEGKENGNTVIVDYTSTYTSYSDGSEPIPFGSCTGDHTIVKRTDVTYKAPDQYAPAMGDDTVVEKYPLDDAIEFAKSRSSRLRDYLSSHSQAFLSNASCNEFTAGDTTWDLYFGVSGDEEAYHIMVTKTTAEDYGLEAVTLIDKSVGDYTTILTFTSAEKVMKGNVAINSKVYTTSGSFKLSSYSFGCRSDVPIPTPDVPISTDFITGATQYYFYVESKDGEYSAGIDGGTGQVLFIKQ
jgi:PKD repeat protein